jgi:hypothetical protein
LESLVKEGFLIKKSEIIDENDLLEKSIEYEISLLICWSTCSEGHVDLKIK